MPSVLLHLGAKRRSQINLLKGLNFCLWIEEGLLQGSCWPLSRQQNKWSQRHAVARDSVDSDKKDLMTKPPSANGVGGVA